MAIIQILLYQPSQVISVTVVLGDKLISQICQAMSPDNNLRATGPRAPVSRDRCIQKVAQKQAKFPSLKVEYLENGMY